MCFLIACSHSRVFPFGGGGERFVRSRESIPGEVDFVRWERRGDVRRCVVLGGEGLRLGF